MGGGSFVRFRAARFRKSRGATRSRDLDSRFQRRFVAEQRGLPREEMVIDFLGCAGDLGELGAVRNQGIFDAELFGDSVTIGFDLVLPLDLGLREGEMAGIATGTARKGLRVAGETFTQGGRKGANEAVVAFTEVNALEDRGLRVALVGGFGDLEHEGVAANFERRGVEALRLVFAPVPDGVEDAEAGAAEAFTGSTIRPSFGDAENLAPLLAEADLVVHSPAVTLGFPTVRPAIERDLRTFAAGAIPLVGEGGARGRLLISEPEWALRLLGNRWRVGVTGTKGKSTTSNLIATILARDPSHPVELGGNNGKPLIGRAVALPPETRVVIELSELQLPSLHSAVDVGVFTNVTVDHLDRHGSVGAYRSVKRLLTDRIADDGVMVVNPAKHAHVKQADAQKFVDWITSAAGQGVIADYKIGGEQLFFPNAGQEGV